MVVLGIELRDDANFFHVAIVNDAVPYIKTVVHVTIPRLDELNLDLLESASFLKKLSDSLVITVAATTGAEHFEV